jgi:hypothetical protein
MRRQNLENRRKIKDFRCMKNKFNIHLVLVLTTISMFSQEMNKSGWEINNSIEKDSISIEPIPFLLGTLSNNMDIIFDSYSNYEKPLMVYIKKYSDEKFNITLNETKNTFTSEELSLKLKFYLIKNKIDLNKLNTDSQKLSFILGIYYRYGEKINDTLIKIQVRNSQKIVDCQSILMELNCKNILYKRLDNYPKQYVLYFEATDILLNYFNNIEREKEILNESYIQKLRTKKENRNKHIELNREENEKIIEVINLK